VQSRVFTAICILLHHAVIAILGILFTGSLHIAARICDAKDVRI
jgi:hypothetical protein